MYTFMITLARSQPSLDLDGTLIIELLFFIAVWIGLTAFVFKPYFRALRARREQTEGARQRAQRLEQRAQKLLRTYELLLQSAKVEGHTLEREWLDKASREAEAIRKKAQEQAHHTLETEREKIQREWEELRTFIAPQAQNIAQEMGRKLLSF